jgi:hypothetical protein
VQIVRSLSKAIGGHSDHLAEFLSLRRGSRRPVLASDLSGKEAAEMTRALIIVSIVLVLIVLIAFGWF